MRTPSATPTRFAAHLPLLMTLSLPLSLFSCGDGAASGDCGNVLVSADSRPPLQMPTATPRACVTRVTDHIGHNNPVTIHLGSRHQALNADETLVLLRSRHVMRLRDSAFVAQLPAADSPWVWSPQKPSLAYAFVGTQLLSYDLLAGAHKVVAEFAGVYERLLTETDLSETSSDGRKLMLGAQGLNVAGGGKALLQVNLEDGKVLSSTAVDVNDVGSHLSPRWLQMLPHGHGFLAAWPQTGLSRQAGIELYDERGVFVRQVDAHGASGDVAVAPDGSVWFVHTAPQPGVPGVQGVARTPLTDAEGRIAFGPAQPLLLLDVSLQAQITCLARGKSFCVVATSQEGGGHPHEGEIFRLELTSHAAAPKLQTLLQHHSAPLGVYRHSEEVCPVSPVAVLPHPSLDRTGRHVLFASNWGDHCFAELYMLRLP